LVVPAGFRRDAGVVLSIGVDGLWVVVKEPAPEPRKRWLNYIVSILFTDIPFIEYKTCRRFTPGAVAH
jgi:hypothetical protein